MASTVTKEQIFDEVSKILVEELEINANDVKENGIYAIGVNDNNKNFPFNGGTLLVFFGVVSWGFQLFVPYSISNNGVFVRNYFGSEWSSWKQL